MSIFSFNFLRSVTAQAVIWPPIDFELIEARNAGLLRGHILNAGAGWRDLSHLIEGALINQDITWPGDDRKNVDIFSPLHDIPVSNATFDTILCIAVLEHVVNPDEIIPEFFRVLKPGGYVIASVPFLQPEHKIPTDYQRYTKDGLERRFLRNNFEVVSTRNVFNVYFTLHWIVYEWLHLSDSLIYKALRVAILPLLLYLAKTSRLSSDKLASVFQIIARKPV
ncbi:MAG: class I SAM-dependent methyltransferase [Aeromicrobium sp.]|nr:class I SAM-dependent methyltransferase [Burkholderiales bacterium]